MWSQQPFKAIFIIFFVIKAPAHLMLLAVLYLFKPFRPQPERPLRYNMTVALSRMAFKLCAKIHLSDLFNDNFDSAMERHVRVEPLEPDTLTGVATMDKPVAATGAGVEKPPLDAVWFPSLPPTVKAELEKERLVLHFPGGAFAVRFGHKRFGEGVHQILAQEMGATRTLWAQFRVRARFPDPLRDALAFYTHVLSLGYGAKQVVVSGDSAGGNVALALLRYIEGTQSRQTPLPAPGGAVIFSPWVHISPRAGDDFDSQPKSRADLLVGPILQWGAEEYRPPGELSDEVEGYLSPLFHPFRLPVPLFIQDGAEEGFHADIEAFAGKMMQVPGNQVQLHSIPLADHDIVLNYRQNGMAEQMREAVCRAQSFLWEQEH